MRCLTLAALLVAVPSVAQTAALDPTFGTGGITVAPWGETTDAARLPDGRLLIVGEFGTDWSIGRLTADGQPDATFGANGLRTHDVAGQQDFSPRVLVLPDGRFVVAGTANVEQGGLVVRRFAAARFLADGTPDASYGTGGTVTLGDDAFLNGAALDSQGRVLVTGLSGANGYLVARFTADGQPDASFGTGGLVTLPFTGIAFTVTPLPDGHVLVGGRTAQSQETRLVRLDATGALDATFGTTGAVVLNLARLGEEIESVERLADGRFLITARLRDRSDTWGVAVASAAGVLDPAFGVSGIQTVDVGASQFFAEPAPAVVRPDGSLVLAGTVPGTFLDGDAGLAHLSASGTLDTTFGTFGIVRADAGRNDRAVRLFVQPDGAAVVVGVRFGGGTGMFALRVRANLPTAPAGDYLDRTFGTNGFASARVFAEQPDARLLATTADGLVRLEASGALDPTYGATAALPPQRRGVRLADGRTLVVGGVSADAPTRTLPQAMLFDLDGQPVASFGTGGALTFDGVWDTFAGSASFTTAVLQPDGSLLLVGEGTSATAPRLFVLRVDPSGMPDPGYGTGGAFYAPASFPERGGPCAALQTTGALVVCGQRTLLLRLTEAGAFDPSFGGADGAPAGTATLYGRNASSSQLFPPLIGSLDLLPGGDLLAGGVAANGTTLVAARLTADGLPVATFGNAGIVAVPAFAVDNTRVTMHVRPDGRLAWTGVARTNHTPSLADQDFAVWIAGADGRLDESSGVFGIHHAAVAGAQFTLGNAGSVALADGAYLVGGEARIVLVPGTIATAPTPAEPGVAVVIWPNPTAGRATVRLDGLAPNASARVTLIDALGREVAVLADGPLDAGTLSIPAGLAPGIYAVVARAGQRTTSTRVVVVR